MPPFLPLHGCRPRSAYAGLIKSVAASNAKISLVFIRITNLKEVLNMTKNSLLYIRNESLLRTLSLIHELGKEFTLPQLIAKGQSHHRHHSVRA